MRLVTVVGTRPQLIKAAALQPVLRRRHEEVFVDTGQHWDDSMAGSFFRELDLRAPDHSLGVGGGSHAQQTAAMLERLEPILVDQRPDAVLVFGDTNSTLAGALAAAKLGLRVAHVEAGLRSHDRRMPEELNRVVADHLSTWLFAPTDAAVANLAAEGLTSGVSLVGDVLRDLAARLLPAVRDPAAIEVLGDRVRAGRYIFATVHRQENREAAAVRRWADLLQRLASPDRPVLLAIHPGTRRVVAQLEMDLGPDVLLLDPQPYGLSLALQLHAAAVVTDSGGVQREAAWLDVPCLVLRNTTEWPEAVDGARGRLLVIGLDAARAAAALDALAPVDASPREAADRAARLAISPSGAAESIARILAGA